MFDFLLYSVNFSKIIVFGKSKKKFIAVLISCQICDEKFLRKYNYSVTAEKFLELGSHSVSMAQKN